MADLNERDARLVLWLNEAYAKEAELEMDLQAHIRLTKKDSYKKRLQAHLKDTKNHKKLVQKRIKALGGTAYAGPDIPLVPTVAGEAAGKAVAAIKGQVDAAKALLTEQAETHLRNAQAELREEQVEIALYTRIETFATEVGDAETAKLAKTILRDEEKMAKFLSAELPRLVKAIVKADVPRDQRTPAASSSSARRRTSASRSAASTTKGSGAASTTARRARGTRATGKTRAGART